MVQVVIQPSYGNSASRRRWDKTLGSLVPFRDEPYAARLTADQLTSLDRFHGPEGARFWAATAVHDRRMSGLAAGDVVLFTGMKMVRAVGKVAHSFRNKDFADLLWPPDPGGDSWSNVYSLLDFHPVEIPYSEIWDLPSFNAGDNFMGLRFLDARKGQEILDGLRIDISSAARMRHDETTLLVRLGEPEAVWVGHTQYERQAGTVTVHRAEAVLLERYRRTLDGSVRRIWTPAGVTDLHVERCGQVELVEAKSGVTDDHLRRAVGQLLHYVLHTPHPVARLTVLLPERPDDSGLDYLLHYGIGCVYWTGDSGFVRVEPDDARRALARRLWAVKVGGR